MNITLGIDYWCISIEKVILSTFDTYKSSINKSFKKRRLSSLS